MRRTVRLAPAALLGLAALAPGAALAHSGAGHLGGFAAGLAHPLLGLDHLLAMLGVGLWASRLGMQGRPRALWAVPLAFVAAMALGGGAALAGLALPGVELGIAGSVLLLGLLVAAPFLVPTGAAMALVAAFALFHGHAHGLEMPAAAQPAAYAAGFLAATAALHAAGVALGLVAGSAARVPAVRLAGGALALAGLWLTVGA